MALDLRAQWMSHLSQLRFVATQKRLRARLADETVLDTWDAVLVWEPRPDNPGLGGRVVMHWEPFTWQEEDEVVVGHPHDPFARVDTRRSDRHVRVVVGDTVVAESDRPVALFETGLPVRWYLPRADVRMELLEPSATHTTCAYKGVASYLSAEGAPDVAWYYPDPLHDAAPVRDLLCFSGDATVEVDRVPVEVSMPGQDRARPRASLVAVRRLRGEGREADGDVLCTVRTGGIPDPLPRPGHDGLAGRHVEHAPVVLDDDGAGEDEGVLVEVRRLRRLAPPGGRRHVRDGQRLVAGVDPPDVLLDDLAAGHRDGRRRRDETGHAGSFRRCGR